MSSAARVALVTCAAFPDLWDDDHPLRDALRERGVIVEAVSWDDPAADWSRFDLTVLRSPWDYISRRDEFVTWAHSVPRLANPAGIVAWNTDKTYLRDLDRAGVPIIPTDFVAPGETWTPPAAGDWVVKPAISAGSQDTARYALPAQRDLAAAHVIRLTEAGRTAMIQPFLPAVDTAGETAVLCFPDATGELTFSHAARKSAMLRGPGEGAHDLTTEQITPRTPSPAELEVARLALAAIPDAKNLLYARVDLIPGPDGPLLIELELTEPSLFLRTSETAAARLAEAILARL